MEANTSSYPTHEHTEQTKFLEFYITCFIIPPLLNDPQFLSLESDQVKLYVEFF